MDSDTYTCKCGQLFRTDQVQCTIDTICLTCREAMNNPLRNTIPLTGVDPEPGNWIN